jgi:hypothetical protein
VAPFNETWWHEHQQGRQCIVGGFEAVAAHRTADVTRLLLLLLLLIGKTALEAGLTTPLVRQLLRTTLLC